MIRRTIFLLALAASACGYGGLDDIAFTYTPVRGSSPTGWIDSWAGDGFAPTAMAVGPGEADVFAVTPSNHPWASLAPVSHERTLCVVADASRTVQKGVIVSVGDRDGGFAALVRDGDEVKLVRGSAGAVSATVAVLGGVTGGYASYAFVWGGGAAAKADGDGFAIGTVAGGLPVSLKAGTGTAVAGVTGWDEALGEAEVASLNATPVRTTFSYDVNYAEVDGELVASLSAAGAGQRFGADAGKVTVPAGADIALPCLRFLSSGNMRTVHLDVSGRLRVTSLSSDWNVSGEIDGHRGVLFGEWGGRGIYRVTGVFEAPDAYVTLAGNTGVEQLLDIDGGTVVVRGIDSERAGVGRIRLGGGGTLRVREYRPAADHRALLREYGCGTVSYLTSGTDPDDISLTDRTDGTVFLADGVTNAYTGSIVGTGRAVLRARNGGAVVFPAVTSDLLAAEGAVRLEGEIGGTAQIAAGVTLLKAFRAGVVEVFGDVVIGIPGAGVGSVIATATASVPTVTPGSVAAIGNRRYPLAVSGSDVVLGEPLDLVLQLSTPEMGMNFTNLTVRGTLTGGTGSREVKVTMTAASGATVVKTVPVAADDTFSVVFQGERGGIYAFSAVARIGGTERAEATAVTSLLVGRVSETGWIDEDTATYQKLREGSGVWSGTRYAQVGEGRIAIDTIGDGDDSDMSAAVTFMPTRALGTVTGYLIRLDLSFDSDGDVPEAKGLWGVTLALDANHEVAFAVLDNGVWRYVSRGVYAPIVDKSYSVEIAVNERTRELAYTLLLGPDRILLANGRLPANGPTRTTSIDFSGRGSLASIGGDGWNAAMLTARVDFGAGEWSDGSVQAGVNFTNLNLDATITVSRIWETDVDSGLVISTVRGANGEVKGSVTNHWSGLDTPIPVSALVDGLDLGAIYSVDVTVVPDDEALADGVEGGLVSTYGYMGRELDGLWFREDALSVEDAALRTGYWDEGENIAISGRGRRILFDTVDNERDVGDSVFTPTNSRPASATGFRAVVSAVFPDSFERADVEADTSGYFGVTVVSDDGVDPRLAFLVDGSWRYLPRSEFAPEYDRAYEFVILGGVSGGTSWISLRLRERDGLRELYRTPVSTGFAETVGEFVFSGNGACEIFEGALYDESLLTVDWSFENGTWGDGSLRAGMNFTNLSLNAVITVDKVWATDLERGKIIATVRDASGNAVLVTTNDWAGCGVPIPVSGLVDGLDVGATYTVDVTVAPEGVAFQNSVLEGEYSTYALMARELGDDWFREDTDTVETPELRTGRWEVGDGMTLSGNGRRIVLGVDTEASVVSSTRFVPTNAMPAHVTALRTVVRPVFASGAEFGTLMTPETGRFALTAVNSADLRMNLATWADDGLGWQLVDSSLYRPEAGRENVFVTISGEDYVDLYVEVNGQLRQLVRRGAAGFAGTRGYRFDGRGELGVFNGRLYDESLLAADLALEAGLWEDGTLHAGMNFTNLNLGATLTVTNLWATDIDHGWVITTVRDAQGVTIAHTTNEWAGFNVPISITNLVDGLLSGGNYQVDLSIVPADNSFRYAFEAGDIHKPAVLAREITNTVWYSESGATVGGRKPVTGEWTVDRGCTLSGEGDRIVIRTAPDSDYTRITFAPTNAVPKTVTDTVSYFRTGFDTAAAFETLPSPEGYLYGLAASFLADGDDSPALTLIVDGVWRMIDLDGFDYGREYDFRIVTGPDGVLYYVGDGRGGWIYLATNPIPAGTDFVPGGFDFNGNGSLSRMDGVLMDDCTVELSFDTGNFQPGTNFTAVAAVGRLVVTPLWLTDQTNGTVKVTVRDPSGAVIREFQTEYHGTTAIELYVDGLVPGTDYRVDVEAAHDEGRTTGEPGETIAVPTARRLDGLWIDEDASTFAGERPGSGSWNGDLGTALVKGVGADRVVSFASGRFESIEFTAGLDTLGVRSSTQREIRFVLRCDTPGFFLSDNERPEVRATDFAAVTIGCDDSTDDPRYFFAVYSEGEWRRCEVEGITPVLGADYGISVMINYGRPVSGADSHALVTESCSWYVTVDGIDRLLLVTAPSRRIGPAESGNRNIVRFSGCGALRSMQGWCYDSHAARVGNDEFWTIDDAVRFVGDSGTAITPLWYTVFDATGWDEGWFGVSDLHVPPYLSFLWPVGVMVEITTDDEGIVYYRFRASDNWIDFADIAGIDTNATPWRVLTANGLAWLARTARDRGWLEADVRLAADITNLAEHCWTPVRGFTGTFEGDGVTNVIAGLRNGAYAGSFTNAFGTSGYALFASSSNAVFRNLVLTDVAVTNAADATAALVGAPIGDLEVSGVTVKSGVLRGEGRATAGLVGLADRYQTLVLSGNTNLAAVANAATVPAAYVAGIANLAGFTDPDEGRGTVTVTGNFNAGELETTVRSDANGGNAAQIAAGTLRNARFASVTATGNTGNGDVTKISSVKHAGRTLPVPVVNFAFAMSKQDEEGYARYIEANDSSAVLIDPCYLTARMTAAYMQNGAFNASGFVNDLVSTTPAGGTVLLTRPLVTAVQGVYDFGFETWSPIVLDRRVTLDLSGNIVAAVFEHNAFEVRGDYSGAEVKNGKAVVMDADHFANIAPGTTWTTNDLKVAYWSTDKYWELEQPGIFYEGDLIAVPNYSAAAAVLSLLPEMGYTVAEDDGVYTVEFTGGSGTMPPEVSLAFDPAVTETIEVKGAVPGFNYILETKTSLLEKEWRVMKTATVKSAGESIDFPIDMSGESGFFRIRIVPLP